MKLELFEGSYQIEVLTTDTSFTDELIKFKLKELNAYRSSPHYWARVTTDTKDKRYVLENNHLRLHKEFNIN